MRVRGVLLWSEQDFRGSVIFRCRDFCFSGYGELIVNSWWFRMSPLCDGRAVMLLCHRHLLRALRRTSVLGGHFVR